MKIIFRLNDQVQVANGERPPLSIDLCSNISGTATINTNGLVTLTGGHNNCQFEIQEGVRVVIGQGASFNLTELTINNQVINLSREGIKLTAGSPFVTDEGVVDTNVILAANQYCDSLDNSKMETIKTLIEFITVYFSNGVPNIEDINYDDFKILTHTYPKHNELLKRVGIDVEAVDIFIAVNYLHLHGISKSLTDSTLSVLPHELVTIIGSFAVSSSEDTKCLGTDVTDNEFVA